MLGIKLGWVTFVQGKQSTCELYLSGLCPVLFFQGLMPIMFPPQKNCFSFYDLTCSGFVKFIIGFPNPLVM